MRSWIYVLPVLVVAVPARATAEDAAEGTDNMSRQVSAPTEKPANRLIHETSPYLLQHAHNPVDWFPWGDEAIAKARAENKPIFLSIGYSACHWCHVMERESFENAGIAALLNADFVSVKVDREERPDLDEIYMAAVVAMNGQGGWPMSVFLTPDLKPFYGGTYYPPVDMYGRPGFATVLARIADAWKHRRDEVRESADGLTDYVRAQLEETRGEAGALALDMVRNAAADLRRTFDARHGGWGGAPKFPSSPSIALLLREHRRTGDAELLHMATFTLDRMAYGGMYDQIGGGFHRYSVDAEWLVPHFEKMLYDNAQLAQAYLEAYQATRKPIYRRVAGEILEYVLRDLRAPEGAFYSSEDADSEGEEGTFYLWTHGEIMDLLGPEAGRVFVRYYGIREDGNFASHEPAHAGQNIPHVSEPPETVAEALGTTVEALEDTLARARAHLLEARAKRARPGLDDKVLTSWNALMISAFSHGARILDEPRYGDAAERAGRFLRERMTRDGQLLRTHRKGESRLPGYLDDYAFAANSYLDLYETTFDADWIDAADALAATMSAKFWDDAAGAFRFTADEHAYLIARSRPTYDGAEPSGNSMAAFALLRLARLLDKPAYHEQARRLLEGNAHAMTQYPRAFLKMICAVEFLLDAPKEIAIAGVTGSDETAALLRAVNDAFVPNKVIAFIDPNNPAAPDLARRIPLLEGKTLIDGKVAAYVCENFVCAAPATDPAALRRRLRE